VLLPALEVGASRLLLEVDRADTSVKGTGDEEEEVEEERARDWSCW